MATQLFKLVIDADTITDTAINPEVVQYFYPLNAADRVGEILTIPATQFIDDEGNAMTGNLTPVTTDNGYYLLFINGVLQQYGLYTVAADGSEVVINDTSTILVGAPITLIVTNFDPLTDSNTTVTT